MAGKSQEWKAKTPCIHKTQLLFVHFHVLSWHSYEIKFTHCIIYLAFLSTNNHFEDLMRSSPPERSTGDKIYTDTGDSSHQSPYYSSGLSPHLSSGSASGSSPFSRHSSRKKGDVMCYIKIIEMCNTILTICITQCFSIPLQVQHQTTVMALWWRTRGVLAHLLLSHYLLNPGRGAQAKPLLTIPKVSTPMILLRKVLTKGNFFPRIYIMSKLSVLGLVLLKGYSLLLSTSVFHSVDFYYVNMVTFLPFFLGTIEICIIL